MFRSIGDTCPVRRKNFRPKIYPKGVSPGSTITLGAWGERRVARFLKRSGYTVLAQNWRNYRGELDIIAYHGQTLVFIEVKTRREEVSVDFAPLDGVTRTKQRRIAQLSHRYIRAHAKKLKRLRLRHIRYDIIGVIYRGLLIPPDILHYRGAFEPTTVIGLSHIR